jgi:glyoxylase-like metal-dependent hydrolase (beta-lactamase superfamily II)
MTRIWALRSRLEKQPTDLRQNTSYFGDRTLVLKRLMAETPVIYTVGEFTITRVLEKLIDSLTPEYLFPEWDPAVMRKHPQGMPPCCWRDMHKQVVLSSHTWVIKSRKHTVLVDTGIGNDKKRKLPDFDHLNEPYLDRLAAVGVTPEAVDYVLLTHLHTDHVGWNTQLLEGRWVPTFPKAKYVFSEIEYEYFSGPDGRDRPNFALYEDSVLPIVEAGQAEMIGSDCGEFIDGFVFNPTPGHSLGHMSISLRSRGEEAFFGGDVVHLPVQIYRPDWNSVFSASPERGRLSRLWALEHANEQHAMFFSSHFPGSSVGLVERDDDQFSWRWL